MQASITASLRCGALRPFTPTRQQQRLAPAASITRMRSIRCSATEESSKPAADAAPQEQPSAAVPPPPAPQPPREQFDYRDAPDALGPVGNFLMATLLIMLCGASVFFTVGRQFQADLVPLVADEYEQMMAQASSK